MSVDESLLVPLLAERNATKAEGEGSRKDAVEGKVEWHPLLNAEERKPGVWTMLDATGRAYGLIRIIREGPAIVCVCELRGERLGGRNVRLRDAAQHLHQAYVARQTSRRGSGPMIGQI